ncbi:hypothetical protein THMIRHAS_18370 [Thiosulfatimonas sediminis]|uniref:Lysozyme inhibitor LprI N-terminal domain-containing protein n=1 Tax=Thiosulfatimonas sediminis TaxID=2675054 RepID=A0A6F8PWS8_9GAMM|nr:hypothetical protein [Thiosulfatimonas sediminis]BBP46464.1 hypothetical protein THMIRHAS_18370 [Thiosulfatimonas sediminis]
MGCYSKGVLVALLFSVSTLSGAVDTTDFTQPGMKQLAHEKRAMELCLQDIDEIQQIQLEAQLNDLDNRLLDLCQSGKRAEAQRTVVDFSKKVFHLALFQKIQGCTQGMRNLGFLPPLPVVNPSADETQLAKICDYYHPYLQKSF